jgi:hypothetical protein
MMALPPGHGLTDIIFTGADTLYEVTLRRADIRTAAAFYTVHDVVFLQLIDIFAASGGVETGRHQMHGAGLKTSPAANALSFQGNLGLLRIENQDGIIIFENGNIGPVEGD